MYEYNQLTAVLPTIFVNYIVLPTIFVNYIYFLVRSDNKNKKASEKISKAFAVRTGLEPATPGVTGRYSNQLNYRTICSDFMRFP